ncbi:MAG TPA: EAL domain-containing protein [Mycobacteriales bacterium]|nr:EAL domain-containing protein [Mycobacteriales bacterium]
MRGTSSLPERGDGYTPIAPPTPEMFVELLTRVGCHIYSGEVIPGGGYNELYTGPGIEIFLGGSPEPGTDLSAAWARAVHPDDRDAYLDAATIDGSGVMQVEYRMLGLDGATRWVQDQMWLREQLPDGRRIIDGVVTDITSRKQAELGLRRLAHTDPLTGLANRLSLADRIGMAVDGLAATASPGIALLMLDLDGFKAVNDTYGHAIGDELLMMVARRLRGSLRPADLVARLGGDEFAVLLERVDHHQTLAAAQRLLIAVNAPFAFSRGTISLSASIGLCHAGDARGTLDLMRDADVAMYRAKADGKNRIVSFEPAMQARVARRLRLETELRRSVDNGDFVLHYQPLVDLETLEVIGAEALLRWRHPERGLLLPTAFVDIAEDTGLILPLGRWVLEQAAKDASIWQDVAGAPFSVSANLSPSQLHDPDLVAIVVAILQDADLQPESLVVEITENLLLKDAELARSRLSALRSVGVKVAVDDFGTGYSSFAYLDRYPVDILKIDRSFVGSLGGRPRASVLVRSILDLALAFDLETVAEGIETTDQLRTLRSLGCRFGQGFRFAVPRPAEQITSMLTTDALAGMRDERLDDAADDAADEHAAAAG